MRTNFLKLEHVRFRWPRPDESFVNRITRPPPPEQERLRAVNRGLSDKLEQQVVAVVNHVSDTRPQETNVLVVVVAAAAVVEIVVHVLASPFARRAPASFSSLLYRYI